MTKVAFFRKFSFEAEVEMSLRLLSFSAGWSNAIDPESGMSVSLLDVDRWILGAIEKGKDRSWKSLESLLRYMQSEGLNPSRGSSARLCRVEIEDSLLAEKVIWEEGQFWHSKTLQIQGRMNRKLRVFNVEVVGPQFFSEPEEMFQFDVEGPEEALEVLRALLRLQEGERLVLKDPLNDISWSE